MKICSIEGCEKQVSSRGWCEKHYYRWRRHGDASICLTNKGLSAEECFRTHVKRSENGYWTWTGGTFTSGYGHFHVKRRSVGAHVFAYEQYVGPIPKGMEIDHCCRVPTCVDIRCLDAVTHSENIRRTHLTPEEHWALRPKRSEVAA